MNLFGYVDLPVVFFIYPNSPFIVLHVDLVVVYFRALVVSVVLQRIALNWAVLYSIVNVQYC